MGPKRNPWLIAFLALLAVVLVALYVHFIGWRLPWHSADTVRITPNPITHVRAPQKPAVLKAAPVRAASHATCTSDDCKHRLAAMHAKVAWKHAHHLMTDAQAAAADRYLDAKPYGDALDKDGTVRWTYKPGDCCTISMSYHACGCGTEEVVKIDIVCPKPKPKIVVHRYQPPPRDNCVEVPFDAPIGSKVVWIIGSTDGPMPKSQCNKQKQGRGGYHDWYDDQCPNWCVGDMLAYIQGVIGEAAEDVVDHIYGASERKQTLRFSTAIWTKSLGICVEYPDHTMHAVYIHPVGPGAWNHRHRVPIPDSLWKQGS
jgi:hypothetical protein